MSQNRIDENFTLVLVTCGAVGSQAILRTNVDKFYDTIWAYARNNPHENTVGILLMDYW